MTFFPLISAQIHLRPGVSRVGRTAGGGGVESRATADRAQPGLQRHRSRVRTDRVRQGSYILTFSFPCSSLTLIVILYIFSRC